MARNTYTIHSVTQALNRQRKKLNANACGKKAKKGGNWTQMPVAKKAKKEAEHKSGQWQNNNDRRNNTNASVKQKMAALTIPGKQTNETSWPDGNDGKMLKMMKKDKEESVLEENPPLPPDQKTYMVTNWPWPCAVWQRLEMHNPSTQYKPHNNTNKHWAVDVHEVYRS